MKIVFMGTPDFARDSLEAIYNAGHDILAVVTNVDKPKGRGMKMIATPVKEFAIEKNLPVFQPEKVKKNEEFINEIKSLNPDIICVVAYGKILPKEILDIPQYGCINVHASLLPKYRGAAPIQWSVLNGDKETGVTPQGDAKLKGAVYEVYAAEDIYNKAKTKKFYSNGDLVATRTMNEKGETEDVTELPLGKYKIKEKTASEGYFVDNTEYSVILAYKDQNTKVITNKTTSNEQVKKMGVHIFKSGINIQSGLVQGLEEAEFSIKLNSAVEKAYSQGYSYAEVWGGLDENGNKVSVNANRVLQAQAIAPTYEIITTDSHGNAYTQNKLPYGKYIVKETNNPSRF